MPKNPKELVPFANPEAFAMLERVESSAPLPVEEQRPLPDEAVAAKLRAAVATAEAASKPTVEEHPRGTELLEEPQPVAQSSGTTTPP